VRALSTTQAAPCPTTPDRVVAKSSESKAARGMACAQLVILLLCVARAGIDLLRGPFGPEGGLALGLTLFIALRMARNVPHLRGGRF
jgi:hypothetical protein